MDRISFDTGYDARTLEPMLERFAIARKAVFFENEWIILPSWPKHQRWEVRPKIKTGINAILKDLPPNVQNTLVEIGYAYPMDKISIPYAYQPNYLDSDSDTDSDSDAVAGKVSGNPGEDPEPLPRPDIANQLGELMTKLACAKKATA